MPLIDRYISALEKRASRRLEKTLIRSELGAALPSVETLNAATWSSPSVDDLVLTWDDPSTNFGGYLYTEITIYDDWRMRVERRTEQIRGSIYTYTYEANLADSVRLGRAKAKPSVYVRARHKLVTGDYSAPVYLECRKPRPAAPIIDSHEWTGSALHVQLKSSETVECVRHINADAILPI